MLDGNNGRHAVSHVGSCKVRVLFLQDSQLPGIIIYDRGEAGLETCQMGSALRIVNIITEAQHILMKLDVYKRQTMES